MSHIGICVSDWKRSLRFYHDALGFRYAYELEGEGPASETLLELRDVDLRAVYMEREGVRIELLHYASPGHAGDAAPRPMNQLGLTHLSLQVDDLDAVLEAVREHGGHVLEHTRIAVPETDTRVVFVTDPDGTRVELIEPAAGAF